MPDCNPELFEFPSFDRRKIEASFSGGDVSSDGGVLLLQQAGEWPHTIIAGHPVAAMQQQRIIFPQDLIR